MGSCHWKMKYFWPAHQNRSKFWNFWKNDRLSKKVRFTCLKQMLPRRLLEHSAQLTSFKSTLNTIGFIDISKESKKNPKISNYWKNRHFRKIRSFNNFGILDITQNNTFVMCHICHIRASACHKRSSIIFQSIFILRIVILTSITFTQMRFFVVKYDFSSKKRQYYSMKITNICQYLIPSGLENR